MLRSAYFSKTAFPERKELISRAGKVPVRAADCPGAHALWEGAGGCLRQPPGPLPQTGSLSCTPVSSPAVRHLHSFLPRCLRLRLRLRLPLLHACLNFCSISWLTSLTLGYNSLSCILLASQNLTAVHFVFTASQ